MRDGQRARTSESTTLLRVRRALVLLLILALRPDRVLSQPVGSLSGLVHDSVDGVVSDAHVSIRGAGVRTTSDQSGAFRLVGIPAGEVVLEVRRLGYRPFSAPVTIAAGSELEVDLDLSPVPEQLPPVQIHRSPEAYDSRLAGFNARKSKHAGYFVTREKLDRMNSARFVDALREIPGVSMRTLRGGVITVSLRGARCSPLFYMDGFPATSGAMDLGMIDLSGVEGIEVYGGMTSIPAEFMIVSGAERCGVIAVWSRPFRPKPRTQESVSPGEVERLIAEQMVFTVDQVSQPVILLGGARSLPAYPDSLWRARIPGRVVAEFIVGQDGRIEPGTVTIASATHPLFASAVRSALDAGVVFNPAVLNGKPVRQFVVLPFHFDAAARAQDSTTVSR